MLPSWDRPGGPDSGEQALGFGDVAAERQQLVEERTIARSARLWRVVVQNSLRVASCDRACE